MQLLRTASHIKMLMPECPLSLTNKYSTYLLKRGTKLDAHKVRISVGEAVPLNLQQRFCEGYSLSSSSLTMFRFDLLPGAAFFTDDARPNKLSSSGRSSAWEAEGAASVWET